MELIEEVIQIAKQAGAITLQYFGQTLAIEKKSDSSPVTQADKEGNDYIVKSLLQLCPDVPVIAEESELPDYELRKNWKKFWLVDPLDGSKEFIEHSDEYTVNIGLIEEGVPTLGVIYAPAMDTLYFAQRGRGSWKIKGTERARIFSRLPDLITGLDVVESRKHRSEELEEFLKNYKVNRRIPIGSSLKFCLIAEGLADTYPRLGPTMEWDVAAGDCIYRNSGRLGERKSPLMYNKEDLRNPQFVIGLPA